MSEQPPPITMYDLEQFIHAEITSQQQHVHRAERYEAHIWVVTMVLCVIATVCGLIDWVPVIATAPAGRTLLVACFDHWIKGE